MWCNQLPWWLSGKEFTCNADVGSIWSLGLEDPLEREMATYSSILAWEIPWTEAPGGLQSMWLKRVRHDLALNNNSMWYNQTLLNSGTHNAHKKDISRQEESSRDCLAKCEWIQNSDLGCICMFNCLEKFLKIFLLYKRGRCEAKCSWSNSYSYMFIAFFPFLPSPFFPKSLYWKNMLVT